MADYPVKKVTKKAAKPASKSKPKARQVKTVNPTASRWSSQGRNRP